MSTFEVIVNGQSFIINKNELTEKAINVLLHGCIKAKLSMVRHMNKPIPIHTAIDNICKHGTVTSK